MIPIKTNQCIKAIFSCILYVVLTSINTYAQNNGKATITGSIADEKGKELSNASVVLLKLKDSSLVKGVISNTEGKFAFNYILPGSYCINISLLGYKTAYIAAFTINGEEKL